MGGAGYWPSPLRNLYIFGTGIMIGCINGGDTLVTIGYHPFSGRSEMVSTLCRYWRGGYNDPRDRIYRYPDDWPPPRSRFPMAPIKPLSDVDIWCCFSDSDPAYHRPNDTRPIGIDIALTLYGFTDTFAKDFFFLKYELFNYNNYPINDMYFGIVLDGDIGYHGDDLTKFILNRLFRIGNDTIRIKNLGLIYDYDNHESPSRNWERGIPGAVGIKLLSAPLESITAFKILPSSGESLNDVKWYLALAGYEWHIPGRRIPYDTIDTVAGDKAFLMSLGPFNLLPCSTLTFYYAVIGSRYGESLMIGPKLDSIALIDISKRVEEYFERLIGIKEEFISDNKLSPIEIFYNPIKSFLVLHIKPTTKKEIIRIFDISGKLVKDFILPSQKEVVEIPLKGINPGIYFLGFKGVVKKFIFLK